MEIPEKTKDLLGLIGKEVHIIHGLELLSDTVEYVKVDSDDVLVKLRSLWGGDYFSLSTAYLNRVHAITEFNQQCENRKIEE